MATRSLTAAYESLRAVRRDALVSGIDPVTGVRSVSSGGRAAGLGAAGAAAAGGAAAHSIDMDDDTPQWVRIHQECQLDLAKLKDDIRNLQKLHNNRLKVTFNDGSVADQEREIEGLTTEITQLFRKSEKNLKQVALAGNDGTLSAQEKVTRINVMRTVAAELAKCSKSFRLCQQEYVKNLSEQQKMGDDFKVSGSVIKAALDESNAGLTAAQQQELMQLEQQATEREKDIIKIAQSINELATLFKELHRLIQDQGTILDRIDYNIEQTVVKVKKGRADLEVAEKHSRKALTMKCIGILAIIFLILLIIFIWKESSN